MTNKEALNILKESDKFTIREIKTALEVAQKALEKQVEIVVKDTGDEEEFEFICPICNTDLFELNEDCNFRLEFCPECGQKIKLENYQKEW